MLPLFGGDGRIDVLVVLQAASYVFCVLAAAVFVLRTNENRTLRDDSSALNDIAAYIIRAAFWAVLLIGLTDALISFLRVEGMLEGIVGSEMDNSLARARIRGLYVHMPLIVIGALIASMTRGAMFIWLALAVVAAELSIVITRFVFSYEQAFMGDLVRFWYAALFLFASAYTLFEDGHVRVDVIYAGFSSRTRGKVNAVGAVLLGMLRCWTILTMGMWSKRSILIAPLVGYEVSQSGFGMYIKYLMAGFLSIFAVTMMIQFASSLLESVADGRGEPGARKIESEIIH